MSRSASLMFASLAAIVGFVALLANTGPQRPARTLPSKDAIEAINPAEALLVYCAASNRAVLDVIRAEYEREFGRSVQVQYGPSQTLLSSIEVSRTGDLFLPADDSFISLAREKKLVAEVVPVARMGAIVAVKRGNPQGIRSFADLLRNDVRLVQASADASAIGKLTKHVLTESKLWEQLERATTAFRTTVTDVANDVKIGSADAGIVYDAVLHTYPDLEAVALPELNALSSQVSVGVVASTQQPQNALHFARYVAAMDRGLLHYAKFGFKVERGDKWSDVPELSVFAGSMLRPAIDDTIKEFEQREGVRVSRVYNGCGILVAQMKAGQRPDAYFACDKEFMNDVPDLFPNPVDVSKNELVILVKKGNPHGVTTLRDLTREGLRVGIGHEKQCAMGWLTQNTLREGGIQKEVMSNVKVEVPAGDMLVNQMRAGALDAAIVYLSNASGCADHFDAYRIPGLQCAVATQPLAISPNSPNAQTASRLFQRLCSVESRKAFLDEGFLWQADLASDDGHDK